MNSINVIKAFAHHIDSIPNSEAIIKELNQKERKLFLKIIQDPSPHDSYQAKNLALHILTLQETFVSKRDVGLWKSFCRSLSNLFLKRVSSSDLITKTKNNRPDLPDRVPTLTEFEANKEARPAIKYKQGEKPLPVNKAKKLGRSGEAGFGTKANVYVHGEDPTLAIKHAGPIEYKIGATLNHPVLAKSHDLYTKEYEDGKKPKNRIVMERIEGKSLNKYQLGNERIPKELAIQLLLQAKDCCAYLYREGVYWADVNDGNIFIESGTNNLRIIDFGWWREESSPQNACQHLLLGAMELAGWIIRNSDVVKNHRGEGDRNLAKQILFPSTFTKGENVDFHQILSTPFQAPYIIENIAFVKDISKFPEEDLETYLNDYFDCVIAAFKEQQTRTD